MDRGEKTEVFKTKLLNRLYGSPQNKDSGITEPLRPGSEPTTAVHSESVLPQENRTKKLYTAALPTEWPPPEVVECSNESQDAQDVTLSSSSSAEASEEEDRRFRKRPRKQRNKQNKANLSETQGGETRAKVQRNLPSDLTKNQKRKLKKKRRKEKMKQEVSGSTNTEFVYVGSTKETEQVVVDTG